MKKNRNSYMEHGSTLFLKSVVLLLGLVVFALCVFVLPSAINTDETGGYKPLLFSMYVPAIPFFIALWQALKLLGYIDKNKAFSKQSIKAFRTIKYCAAAICAFYLATMPYVYIVADRDDAPGVILIGLAFIFASAVIATAAGVLQKLVQHAVDIKSENDLTV